MNNYSAPSIKLGLFYVLKRSGTNKYKQIRINMHV
nr:MAG TPA: hypothetical protein [Caudoviricetes sp.]DAX71480.1 MAG TPA: hypothetical protein [Caudoviricetes sp.]